MFWTLLNISQYYTTSIELNLYIFIQLEMGTAINLNVDDNKWLYFKTVEFIIRCLA